MRSEKSLESFVEEGRKLLFTRLCLRDVFVRILQENPEFYGAPLFGGV